MDTGRPWPSCPRICHCHRKIYPSDDELQDEPNQDFELSPVRANFDPEHDSDLDHYLLGPDGIYLDEISETSFDSIAELDPEPSLGPVDPG